MIINQVVNILFHAAPVMRCPEIFLLLPTCSILHEPHNVIELVLPLAVAITDLNETAMKSLSKILLPLLIHAHIHFCRYVHRDKNRNPCSFMERLEVVLTQFCHLYFPPVSVHCSLQHNKHCFSVLFWVHAILFAFQPCFSSRPISASGLSLVCYPIVSTFSVLAHWFLYLVAKSYQALMLLSLSWFLHALISSSMYSISFLFSVAYNYTLQLWICLRFDPILDFWRHFMDCP